MDSQHKKVREFFDSLAPQWDLMKGNDDRGEKTETLVKLVAPKKGGKFLDIGSGTGFLIPILLEYGPEKIQSIDISPKMTEICAGKYKDDETVTCDCVDFFEFDGTGFDFAVCYSAYPHFREKEEFARKLSECLVPGGRFAIIHPESKEKVNHRHEGGKVEDLSVALKPVLEEMECFIPFFDLDVLMDTSEAYLISGKKRL